MDNLANRNIKITRNTISSNNNNKMDILTKRNIHTKNNDNITFFFQNCKAPTISKVKISGKP